MVQHVLKITIWLHFFFSLKWGKNQNTFDKLSAIQGPEVALPYRIVHSQGFFTFQMIMVCCLMQLLRPTCSYVHTVKEWWPILIHLAAFAVVEYSLGPANRCRQTSLKNSQTRATLHPTGESREQRWRESRSEEGGTGCMYVGGG